MLTVSVIIPVYQNSETVRFAVESALSQSYPPTEIILIDDGSTDDLDKVIEQFNGKIVILKQRNLGVSAARNNGIRHSSGDVIAFLDADDIWLPEKLAKQMPLFDDPRVGGVFGNVYFLFEDKLQKETYFERYKPNRGSIFLSLFALNYIPTLTVLIRRQIFDQVGFFDELLRHAEDYDLWLRVAQISMFDYISDPLAIYRISSHQASKNFIEGSLSLLQLKERVYQSSPTLFENANRNVLERGLYNKYLRLAIFYMREGKVGEAEKILDRYRKIHNVSFVYFLFRIIRVIPAPLLQIIIRSWDAVYQKPEYGFF